MVSTGVRNCQVNSPAGFVGQVQALCEVRPNMAAIDAVRAGNGPAQMAICEYPRHERVGLRGDVRRG
jgi:hypothetical protein